MAIVEDGEGGQLQLTHEAVPVTCCLALMPDVSPAAPMETKHKQ